MRRASHGGALQLIEHAPNTLDQALCTRDCCQHTCTNIHCLILCFSFGCIPCALVAIVGMPEGICIAECSLDTCTGNVHTFAGDIGQTACDGGTTRFAINTLFHTHVREAVCPEWT